MNFGPFEAKSIRIREKEQNDWALCVRLQWSRLLAKTQTFQTLIMFSPQTSADIVFLGALPLNSLKVRYFLPISTSQYSYCLNLLFFSNFAKSAVNLHSGIYLILFENVDNEFCFKLFYSPSKSTKKILNNVAVGPNCHFI